MFRKFPLLAVLLLTLSTAFAEEVAPHTLYLVGEVATTTAEGKWLDSSAYLIQRRVIPNENRIEILSFDVKANKSVTKRTTLMYVTGNTYVVTDLEGSYQGTGEWTGEPWHWKSWRYQVVFPGGKGRLEGEDHLSEHHLSMRKQYFDGTGKLTSIVTASFSKISQKAYELLAAKLWP